MFVFIGRVVVVVVVLGGIGDVRGHGLSHRRGLRRGDHGGDRRDLIAARGRLGDGQDLPAERVDVVNFIIGHPHPLLVVVGGFWHRRDVLVDRPGLSPVVLAGDLLGAVRVGGHRDGPDALRLRWNLAVRHRHLRLRRCKQRRI